MQGTTAQGNRALIAVSAALALCTAIGAVALIGDLAANETWNEIVVSAQDAITHE